MLGISSEGIDVSDKCGVDCRSAKWAQYLQLSIIMQTSIIIAMLSSPVSQEVFIMLLQEYSVSLRPLYLDKSDKYPCSPMSKVVFTQKL
jgi:hypothetical protein